MPTHYEGTKPERRALDAYIKLIRASQAIGTRIEPGLAEDGLSPRQLGVLEALLHLGPLSQKVLSEKLLCSRANITAVIDQLETGGLVAREQDPSDRRSNTVALTDEGDTRIRDVFPRHVARIVDAMSALRPSEQEALAELCRKVGLGPHRAERTKE